MATGLSRPAALGRETLDSEQFRKHAGGRLDLHAADVPVEARHEVLNQIDYVVADVTDPAAVAAAIRGDEAEEAWRIMDPVLAAWAAGVAPLREYPAGSLAHDP